MKSRVMSSPNPPTPPACQNASRQQHQPCTPTSRATLSRFLLFFSVLDWGGSGGGMAYAPLTPKSGLGQRKTTEEAGRGWRRPSDTPAPSARYLRHFGPLRPQPWPQHLPRSPIHALFTALGAPGASALALASPPEPRRPRPMRLGICRCRLRCALASAGVGSGAPWHLQV